MPKNRFEACTDKIPTLTPEEMTAAFDRLRDRLTKQNEELGLLIKYLEGIVGEANK